MKKRKIVLVATGLSAGMLLSSTVVNVPIVWGLSSVQVVKAEELDRGGMKDYELIKAIGDDANLGNPNWTLDELRKHGNDLSLYDRDIYDVTGLENAINSEQIHVGDNYISNFNALFELQNETDFDGRIVIGNQRIEWGYENFQRSLSNHVRIKCNYFDENKPGIDIKIGKVMNKNTNTEEIGIRFESAYDQPYEFDLWFDNGLGIYDVEIIFEVDIGAEGPNAIGTVTVPYEFHITQEPSMSVKDIIVNVGDPIDYEKGYSDAIDENGGILDKNRVIWEGTDNINTASPGEHKFYYYVSGFPYIQFPSKVIVLSNEDSGDVDDNDDGDPNGNNTPGSGGSNSGGGSSSKIEDIAPTNIMTDKKSLPIYNVNGNKLEPKTLTKQTTDFVTEKLNTVGENKFYRIGENEWVNTKDVKVFHYNDGFKQTHGDSHKELTQFRNRGMVENRALKSASSWVTDRYAMFGTEKYHRVATHEWVHDDHVVKYTPISGIVEANENAQLYNSRGNKSNRGLMQGSRFVTDRTATINGELMYRVATDEWVSASLVTLD
ncbi:SLAP domain-containing protein [Companilactobacillus nodensis]|uniref:S-layer protein C-terminal domain-containing protein n=1 Tax=Companilactobacillus nodensis DSM 19682 = JCM 14932 = NBRC 107160 TaxID=1423775 RepID=A0A0R1K8E0_9LACO|nr:SLAP domain-containing protein [Companilactobacillus nodensis]KRK79627.1 hypothetical protein FD03_GL000326 [Companilactobacillus nodensis DSM 19682 = JCM 14932 = NBRC 107160]